MAFSNKTKEKALLKSARRCCICLKYKGVKVEVHHIVPESITQDNTLKNAITLCFDCHSDAGHYNPKHPKGNKFSESELKKHRNRLWKLVQEGKITGEENRDSQFLEMIRKAFDRPVFNTPFRQEGRMENFDKAISDTILALNTGVLRTRDNQIIQELGFGKSSLLNNNWKKDLNEIEVELQDLMVKVAKGLSSGQLKNCNDYCYCGDDKYIDKIDDIRLEIIDKLNKVLMDAYIKPLENLLLFRKRNAN